MHPSGRWYRVFTFVAALSMGHSPGALAAGPETVTTRVFVPLPRDQISAVLLGGQHCPIRQMEPGDSTPIVVVVPGLQRTSYFGTTLLNDLGTALLTLRERRNVEFWGKGGEGAHLVGGEFAEGWVVAPTERDTAPLRRLPGISKVRIIEGVAKRFEGSGPVRVFLYGSSFSWLDLRGNDDYYASPFDGRFDLIGDAGLTLFPVLVPISASPRALKNELKWSAWGSWTLGGTPRVLESVPGSGLLKYIRESDGGTVLTLEVPGRRSSRLTMPPKLEVLGPDGHVLYSRPLAVSGVWSTTSDDFDAGYRMGLYRIVPEMRFERPALVPQCFGQSAPEGQTYLKVNSRASSCGETSQCSSQVHVRPENSQTSGSSAGN
ncbi:MAG: hypothetical protein IPP47_26115 [Bryobacterales bacterium]|nr:hypothetical protein [Bryobacterales bacterium]